MRLHVVGVSALLMVTLTAGCGGAESSRAGADAARGDSCSLLSDADVQTLLPDGVPAPSHTPNPFALFDDCSWIVGKGSNALFLTVRARDAALFENQTLDSYDDFSTRAATIRVQVATDSADGTISGDLWALRGPYLLNLRLQGSGLERATLTSRLVGAANTALERAGS